MERFSEQKSERSGGGATRGQDGKLCNFIQLLFQCCPSTMCQAPCQVVGLQHEVCSGATSVALGVEADDRVNQPL